MNKIKQSKLALLLLMSSCITYASTVTIPNTFTANTPAVAAQVNLNFSNVKTAVDDNDGKITVNESDIITLLDAVTQLQADLAVANTTITSLTTRVSTIENNSVLDLDGFLSLGSYDGYDTAVFSSINIQVNDGSGDTDGMVNGLGNLIIGYNETIAFAQEFCSNPQFDNQIDCIADSEIWDRNVHQGSHNLIMGYGIHIIIIQGSSLGF